MEHVLNPFTPAFGGKPQSFFGREQELGLVRRAINDPNSPYRTLFITGNRGYGKTALLERLSAMARHYQWKTIDVHSAHASQAIVRQLVPALQRSEEKEFSPSALGVELGGVRVSQTWEYDELDLANLLLDASGAMADGRGIFITVDEVQKIPESDMENLCAAFQMSLRKGMPVILVLAGLPQAKERISSFPGCTFMQRAQELRLAALTVDETLEAVAELLGQTRGCSIADGTVGRFAQASKGHPYLVQLIGYYLVERATSDNAAPTLTPDGVDAVFPTAYEAYRANILEPTLGRLGAKTVGYLASMTRLLGSDRRARTGEIAADLGMDDQQASALRQRLIDRRLIEAAGWGYVSFGLPYLDRYFSEVITEELPSSNHWQN